MGGAAARAVAADRGEGLDAGSLDRRPAASLAQGVRKELPMSSNPVHDRIAKDIAENDVLLYMKGTPVFPQCGFSAAVGADPFQAGREVQSRRRAEGPGVRQGIKEFSNWPTIPQLYVKGEFVGGCDIISEMYEQGELEPFLAERGIALETRNERSESKKARSELRLRPFRIRAFANNSARVEFDDQARLHLHRIGHVGQLRRAQEFGGHLAVIDFDVIRHVAFGALRRFQHQRHVLAPWRRSSIVSPSLT